MAKAWHEMTEAERGKFTAMLGNAYGPPLPAIVPPPTAAQLLARRRAYDAGHIPLAEVTSMARAMDPEQVSRVINEYGGTRAWMGW